MLSSRRSHFILLFIFGVFESIRVTITPAFSEKLTSLGFLHFTLSQYGLLFLPFSTAAIASSLWTGGFIERRGLFRPFSVAIAFDLISMYFMGMALLVSFYQHLAMVFLLIALFSSGIGFGLVLPCINTVIADHYPKKTEVYFTLFYLSLSAGSFFLFFSLNLISKFPVVATTFFFFSFLILYLFINFAGVFPKTFHKRTPKLPYSALWSLCVAMMCTGILESLFFDWMLLYTNGLEGFSTEYNHLIYLLFLIFFSLSQLVIGLSLKIISFRLWFGLLPFLLVASLVLTLFIFGHTTAPYLFSLSGFFLACQMPFLIAFTKMMMGNQPKAYGILLAFLAIGYGIGSFGFGESQKWLQDMISKQFFPLALTFSCLLFGANLLSLRRETNNHPNHHEVHHG